MTWIVYLMAPCFMHELHEAPSHDGAERELGIPNQL